MVNSIRFVYCAIVLSISDNFTFVKSLNFSCKMSQFDIKLVSNEYAYNKTNQSFDK